ncbi:MAG: glycerol-3-phosphate dehydrogenase, partial [Clostridia bacterium]|nr:glycerol-3-phosphate dehydrogenase [Clostridia bacterium]
MNITVIGSGRWGSFIAWYLDRQKNNVSIYGRETSSAFAELRKNRKNEYVSFSEDVKFSTDLSATLSQSEIAVISISSQSLRLFLTSTDISLFKGKKVLLCMKGIEEDSGKRLTEVAKECGIDGNDLAVWVGPGHIQEFTAGKPNCMLIDSENHALTKKIADFLRSDLIRFYYGNDLIGSEIGAAAKNVMGIAAGILDGSGMSTLKGALMARGAREVARLIKVMGGNELSAYGLCHRGDYETTLFSKYSNNRNFGEAFI